MDDEEVPIKVPYSLVTRKEWGALPPKYMGQKTRHPIPYVVMTYATGTKECQTDEECSFIMRELQKMHMEKERFFDIGYNFVIGGNGKVYEGRGWNILPESKMFPEKNGKRLDIAFIGDFATGDISDIMFETSMDILNHASDSGFIEEEWETLTIPEDGAEQCHVMEGEE